jgi:anti-sigma regulatory factor (Ser/Thr protein kinase)
MSDEYVIHSEPHQLDLVRLVGYDEEGVLEIIVEDEGDGFDYMYLIDAYERSGGEGSYNAFRSPDNIPECSIGRGLFDILDYCDKIEWNGTGNKVTVTKTLKRKETELST